MKKLFLLFLFPLFIACQNQVDYDITEKEKDKSTDTNNYYITENDASTICIYLQNKKGDSDFTTYEHDTASDTTGMRITKGTSLAQLSLKSYTGFTYYRAVQIGETLNLYYNRNFVTYSFLDSKTNGSYVYKISGLYGTKFFAPTSLQSDDYFLAGWEDENGEELPSTFGTADKKFYPHLISKENKLGSKGIADTKGDILLDDGSVISYEEFSAKADKSGIIEHAYGVLICTTYNSEYISSAVPKMTVDVEDYSFFITLNSEKDDLFGGQQKLIAAVYKDDYRYKNLNWISNNAIFINYQMNLTNYLDGSICTELIKSLKTDDSDYTKTLNAFSACSTYGHDFCPNTIYSEDWYLPSLGEIYALITLINDPKYSDIKTYFYEPDSLKSMEIWSSNSTPSPSYEYGIQNSWTVKFNDNLTVYYTESKARYSDSPSDNWVLPFRKIN
ncbi:hypothetical protein MSI_13270 [Treponema sp. JC4]|uniref:hypothetical protein n=1 Tax=Treponema sp. JC4 TaxID=1124982 RepID=UPI00025B0DFE|nr:hypothetical protein [Treponema sp. JC4]EID85202.1 hypothetical protein MSI_13270 [Treponema sp. JC4]